MVNDPSPPFRSLNKHFHQVGSISTRSINLRVAWPHCWVLSPVKQLVVLGGGQLYVRCMEFQEKVSSAWRRDWLHARGCLKLVSRTSIVSALHGLLRLPCCAVSECVLSSPKNFKRPGPASCGSTPVTSAHRG